MEDELRTIVGYLAALVAAMVLTFAPARAEEDAAGGSLPQLEKIAEHLLRFKISGYIQPRYFGSEADADSIGVTASGTSTANEETFFIRRARLKFLYDGEPWGRGVVYLDGNDLTEIHLLEAYVTVFDPWTEGHLHKLTMGQTTVPFGFEVEYSAKNLELTERSRAANVLFRGERDRGVRLDSKWTESIETTLGVYNGQGIKDGDFPGDDPNKAKDVMGRIRAEAGPTTGGASYYHGITTVPLTGVDVDADRIRFGVEATTRFDVPSVGEAFVYGEVYSGKNVNPDSVKALTTGSGGGGVVLAPGANPDHLATDFLGWYLTWAQRFANDYQFAARYDVYDPNVDVDHDQFERLSLALHGFYGKHIRASGVYEWVRTDSPDGTGGFVDPKDNRFTFQLQFAF